MTMAFLVLFRSGGLDDESPPLRVQGFISSSPTCGTGTHRVPFLQLGVCQGSGTSGGSEQNAAERHPGTGSPAQLGLLQSVLSGAEGNRHVVTCD